MESRRRREDAASSGPAERSHPDAGTGPAAVAGRFPILLFLIPGLSAQLPMPGRQESANRKPRSTRSGSPGTRLGPGGCSPGGSAL